MLHINGTHYGHMVDIVCDTTQTRYQGLIVGVIDYSGVMRITVRITLEQVQRQVSYHYRFNTGSANQWTRVHAHGDEEYTSEGYYTISLGIKRTDIF